MGAQITEFLKSKVGSGLAGLALVSVLFSQVFTFVNTLNASQKSSDPT